MCNVCNSQPADGESRRRAARPCGTHGELIPERMGDRV
jgi:hypothetical protein